jgi:hypothetical protein
MTTAPQLDLVAVNSRQQTTWASGDFAEIATLIETEGGERCVRRRREVRRLVHVLLAVPRRALGRHELDAFQQLEGSILTRYGEAGDGAALERLAGLDSRTLPEGVAHAAGGSRSQASRRRPLRRRSSAPRPSRSRLSRREAPSRE